MRLVKMVVCVSLSALMVHSPVWAQDGEGRGRGRANRQRMQQLDPEKAEAAWTWQAKGFAHDFKLAPVNTDQLVKIYVASRKQLRSAVREARSQAAERPGEGEGRRGGRRGFGPMREQLEKAREALKPELEKVLDPDQTKKAMSSLGTFSGQWDRMVDAILGFGLGDDKTFAAMTPLRMFVVEIGALRESGDWQAMREGMMDAREALLDNLEPVLGEADLEEFEQAISRRRGGRGEGAGRPGRGEGAGRPERPGRGQGAGDRGSNIAMLGRPAPDFTLSDSNGDTVSLAGYQGQIVVLQWINPDCPVCRRVSSSGKVAAMKKQLAGFGNVVHLTVNSTHYMEPSVGAAYLKRYQIDAPALIDRDGKVGRLYGAKTTPHMFVIDTEGILRYQGAFDDDARGAKGDMATNFVVQAVRQIAAGETVSPDSTKSYGCSVKYAPQ